MRACLTVDVEPDCPPFLRSCRGIEEGLPWLLDALARLRVTATFFVTGEVARRFPAAVDRICASGHELGCHGDAHLDYSTLAPEAAARDLLRACDSLRAHAPVTSFRAPYLRLPPCHVPLLRAAGFTVDSSEARYKRPGVRLHREGGLTRVPASVTSSLLRAPDPLRRAVLNRLRDPAVVFVHPWEFVDLRREPIRWDCRFRTGAEARDDLEASLATLHSRGATFVTMRDCRLD